MYKRQVACWEYQGSDEKEPVLLKEPLVYEAIKVQMCIRDRLERAYAPLTYTPLPIIPKLERLFGDLTEYFREQPNTCSRYLDVLSLIHI